MTQFASASDVVTFWTEAGPEKWFAKDEAFDAVFRDQGRTLHWAAARRECDGWMASAEGALALLIMLDQYPRNSFRGTAHQFATDPLALMFANRAVAAGYHLAVEPELKNFLLLPFEHSERIEDQDRYMSLVAGDEDLEKWGRIHRDIIVRFGRFPHRNAALGRETTPDEQAFLDEGGFGG